MCTLSCGDIMGGWMKLDMTDNSVQALSHNASILTNVLCAVNSNSASCAPVIYSMQLVLPFSSREPTNVQMCFLGLLLDILWDGACNTFQGPQPAPSHRRSLS